VLNHIYHLCWSQAQQAWIAVSETTRGRGKQSGSVTAAARSVTAASLLLLSPFAHAAPTGGHIVSGSGSISASGSAGQSTTTINQASDKLSLTWQSFNVAKAESVNFIQPYPSALAVNRILDTQGSQILGNINANGQVWLINPNGLLFGKDAQVNVGALVATTLDTKDAATNQSSQRFGANSTAGIANFGQINAAHGGYVALLGHSVSNQGSINAPGGTAALGAGSAVSLNFEGSKLLGLQVTSNQVNALAMNGGLLQADGGQVLLSAGARDSLLASVVNNTGVVQARTVQEKDGKIILLAGMAAGTTKVRGTLNASAPSGGNGGFIETSAYSVKVDDSATITTASAQGKQGQWLLDPYDFYIAASSDSKSNITGAALSTALGNNNVTIQTVASDNPTVTGATASGSYTSGLGDIYVNDAVSWSANYTLTLNAHNSIYINSPITATGASGKLALLYGQASSAGGSSSYAINAAVSLQAGSNFSTTLGSTGTTKNYTVITSLGSAGDESLESATNSLQGLAHSSRLSGNYVLGADIAASGTSTWNGGSGFSPIGDATTNFTGTFDGLGHTVTGLTINRSSTTFYVGLFGYLGSAGVVKNVGMVSNSVIGGTSVGGLVGRSDGSISNSYATGSVSGVQRVGGLVGRSDGTISSSYATGTVSASTTSVGGLAGSLATGTISSSYATATVTGPNAGGLVGVQDSGAITSSYATGAVTGNLSGAYYTGGLVGKAGATTASTITSSYATGAVSAIGNFTGGLVGGFAVGGSVSTSYATGAVTGTGSHSGGLVGAFVLGAGTISNSYATGAVSGGSYRGGLLGGTAAGAYAISNTYATGVVSSSGATYSGGLVGYLLASSSGGVTSSFWNSDNTASAGFGSAGTGLSSAAMKTASNFSAWSISSAGGSSSTWRIYDGSTSPLLRTFLTPLATDTSTTYTGAVQYGIGYGLSNISGTVASGTNAGSYTSGTLYSNQQGYDLSGSGTLVIAKANLTQVTASKTYDRLSTVKAAEMTAIAGVNGESFTASAGTAAISDKNVATANKTLTDLTGLTLTGVNGGNTDNYNLASGLPAAGTNNAVTITAKTASVSGTLTHASYSGLTQSQTAATTSGFIEGDNITVSGLASGKDASTYTSALTVGGTDASNYNTSITDANLVIAKANLTQVTASKTYDRLSTVKAAEMTAIAGVNGESFTASAGTAAISNKNVATANKTLTDLTGLTLTGVNGGNTDNYNLASGLPAAGTNNAVTITAKALTVSGTTAAGKTYDGNTTAAITVGTLSGFVGSETVSATASGTFDSKETGLRTATATYSLVNGSSGGLAANYSLADTTGHSATIEKAAAEDLNGGGDTPYSASWMRSQVTETELAPWPQTVNGAIPAVEISSPGVRLPESAYQRDLPALAAVNTP
jgi:filamentous hemagglutinin family protein